MPMKYWLVPCVKEVYDIDKAIAMNKGYCYWRDNVFAKGDVVFIYISKPTQCIRYRMTVEETNITETKELMPSSLWPNKILYLNTTFGNNILSKFVLQEKYADSVFPLSSLDAFGLHIEPVSTKQISGSLLQHLLSYKEDDFDPAGNPDMGTDYASEDDLWEGAVDKMFVNHYERNREAREECIRLKGCRCSICGFDFEKAYGPMGRHFIHVHHVVPISSIGKDYKLNVATDLIPVCPNCHAMLHSKPGKYEAYTPDELRAKILSHLKSENVGKGMVINISKLYKIDDDEKVRIFVDRRIEEQGKEFNILAIEKECFDEFWEAYPNMSIPDWYSVLNDYYKRTKNCNDIAAEP